MSISNDDALEIIQRLKCAAWGGPPATPNRCIYLDDAELVIWDQTESGPLPKIRG